MDPIKDAFSKVKQDIQDLKEQLESIKFSLDYLNKSSNSNLDRQTDNPTDRQTHTSQIETHNPSNPTYNLNEPSNMPLKAVKSPISSFSTGNRGVPTDRQTDRQTDRHMNSLENSKKNDFQADNISSIDQVSQVLESLDSIKKELRYKFKRLTSQEMLIFSTIYQLEEEHFTVDYSIIANKLTLSESSIRDYTLKLIKKGIPIQKTKENNKKIVLSIPSDFKKIASLSTILQLREL
ncbi:hypothetical protein COU54_04790 [Candidatus Pacearchaeota archaeon CG10_big_fil_rev_8_21_14_0_10_31_24]|nr:MAG: hypothetical protein COU54_04790 [Candidatus Pacearchaeota archaeon CG10_big_fil_rev_8_21_14_0_10_31_24]